MAYKLENGWFSGGGGGDRSQYEILVEKIGSNVLTGLQTLIVELVRTRDTNSLSNLQACCGQLFKQASECVAANMDMQVEDTEGENETN